MCTSKEKDELLMTNLSNKEGIGSTLVSNSIDPVNQHSMEEEPPLTQAAQQFTCTGDTLNTQEMAIDPTSSASMITKEEMKLRAQILAIAEQ